ncbi:hypothetical protein NDU88_005599 [Pleurodeles waltl]|uniref:Uncharacterized protein n=1 Tax=Pleurodeles waltl TaxID=8319 RepID=A0AAV7L1R7_PLEWA|nr:hypothetical protein NDU88_005599 [Pleurodeles waltl]
MSVPQVHQWMEGQCSGDVRAPGAPVDGRPVQRGCPGGRDRSMESPPGGCTSDGLPIPTTTRPGRRGWRELSTAPVLKPLSLAALPCASQQPLPPLGARCASVPEQTADCRQERLSGEGQGRRYK